MSINSETINSLYGITNTPHDGYIDYMENHLDLDEVVQFFTITSNEWKISKYGNSTFNASAIQFEECKVRYYFIVA